MSSAILLSPPLILAQSAANVSISLHGNTSTVGAHPSKIYCGPLAYGSNLDIESCLQAWEKMPRSSISHTYTPRWHQMPGNILLPLRYLSDDGACAIDVDQRTGSFAAEVDVSTDDAIVAHTTELLEKCVRNRGFGGYVGGFSEYRIPNHASLPVKLPGRFLDLLGTLDLSASHNI